MRKIIPLWALISMTYAQVPAALPPPEAIAEPTTPQYGQRESYEWSGAITGIYSSANTYTTSPAGETKLLQISVAPILNLFVRNRFYMGGGPNFGYNSSQITVPGAPAISIEQAFLGPQVQFGVIWPLSEKLFLNTRAIAIGQMPFVSEYKGIKGADPKVGRVGGEILLQRQYERVLLNVGVQFLYSQYLKNTGTGLQQSEYTTRITFGFSFWVP